MSRDLFYPGQRVRLVVECNNPFTTAPVPQKGTHGSVIVHENTPEFGWQWRVDFDGFPAPFGNGWLCDDTDIEPLDDGRTVVSWDDCAWQPEKVTVTR